MARGAAESYLVHAVTSAINAKIAWAGMLLVNHIPDCSSSRHASSTLLFVCTSCWWIVCVVFLLLQFYAVADELFIQSVHDYIHSLHTYSTSQLAITVLDTYSTNQHAIYTFLHCLWLKYTS